MLRKINQVYCRTAIPFHCQRVKCNPSTIELGYLYKNRLNGEGLVFNNPSAIRRNSRLYFSS